MQVQVQELKMNIIPAGSGCVWIKCWTIKVKIYDGIMQTCLGLGPLMGFYGCGNEPSDSIEVGSSLTR